MWGLMSPSCTRSIFYASSGFPSQKRNRAGTDAQSLSPRGTWTEFYVIGEKKSAEDEGHHGAELPHVRHLMEEEPCEKQREKRRNARERLGLCYWDPVD